MTNKKAMEIVIELAEQNILEDVGPGEDILAEQVATQHEAIEKVTKLKELIYGK
jgi:hypothetical protein